MKIRAWLFAALLLGPVLVSQPAKALVTVLYLSVDVSGSISDVEFNTQRSGWADAIRALANNGNYFSPTNQVYAAFDYFRRTAGDIDVGGANAGFRLLDSATAGNAFADDIESASRPLVLEGTGTGIVNAFSAANSNINTFLSANPSLDPDSIVIDISFDGRDSVACPGSPAPETCLALQQLTQSIVDSGRTINALTVSDGQPGFLTNEELRAYANENMNPTFVFSADISDSTAFTDAAFTKLSTELAPAPLPAAALLPLLGIGRYVRRTRKRIAELDSSRRLS